MLLTAKVISWNFKDNILELSAVNENWNVVLADVLIVRIDDALQNQIGIDPRKELRLATANLKKLIAEVKNDLAIFNLSVKTYYQDQPEKMDEIFNNLGFKIHYKKIHFISHDNIIKFLYTFKTNITEDYRKEFKAIGIKDRLIDNIIEKADIIEAANTVKEKYKGISKEMYYDNLALYNSIYTEIISICKIASSFYKNKSVKKSLFTFNKVAGIVKNSK